MINKNKSKLAQIRLKLPKIRVQIFGCGSKKAEDREENHNFLSQQQLIFIETWLCHQPETFQDIPHHQDFHSPIPDASYDFHDNQTCDIRQDVNHCTQNTEVHYASTTSTMKRVEEEITKNYNTRNSFSMSGKQRDSVHYASARTRSYFEDYKASKMAKHADDSHYACVNILNRSFPPTYPSSPLI